ncbi:hypothetical protein NHX12_018410 [Muraenolepis orangiensis]|uniref:Uncharacterized protein n=1 Tax=Muraenolepis orangiensis TaxID=630683 RepID=A0A9Q0EZ71_9TELE|nr:hypothetical protein NHX12_018410 [Muraenolepis orangiensis]
MSAPAPNSAIPTGKGTDAGGDGETKLGEPLLSLISSTDYHDIIEAASTVDFSTDFESLLKASENGSQLTGGPIRCVTPPDRALLSDSTVSFQ